MLKLRNKKCDLKTAINIPLSDILDDNNIIFLFLFVIIIKNHVVKKLVKLLKSLLKIFSI